MLNKISKSSNKSHLFWQNKFEQIEISLTTQDNLENIEHFWSFCTYYEHIGDFHDTPNFMDHNLRLQRDF